MKDGWNTALQKLLQRADPAAQAIVEAVAVHASDVKDLKSDWDGADSLSGLTSLDEGGVRLSLTNTALASQTVDDGTQITDLNHSDPIEVLHFEWFGSGSDDLRIKHVVLRLDPDADSGGRQVEQWRCQLFRVAQFPREGQVVLDRISRVVSVAATGSAPSNITFDFASATGGRGVAVGRPPIDVDDSAEATGESLEPQTVIRLWAVMGDGEAAPNAAWIIDSAQSSKTGANYTATHKRLNSVYDVGGGGTERFFWQDIYNALPYFEINKPSYAAATVTFTTNDIDLGAVPTGDVEVVAQGSEPSDSSITYQIREPAGTFVDCVDGDLVAIDNTPNGGKDLTSLSKVQLYEIRATLTPNSSGNDTPTASQFGLFELGSTILPTTVATVEGLSWGIDPITLKGSIPEATIRIRKTGEKDYRDIGSDLLAQNDPGNLLFRVWIGHLTDLARSNWMLSEVLEVDDYQNMEDEHVITGISPLRRLRTPVPEFDDTGGGSGTRTAKIFENQTGKAVWDDIVDTVIALPGRHRGPGLESTDYNLSKTIEQSDGKNELDWVAEVHGGSNISSQGRVKYVQILADDDGGQNPIETIPLDDSETVYLSPGLRNVLDEYFVKWDWDDNKFVSENRIFNATAATAFGGHGLDATKFLDDEASKYVTSQTHARDIGNRVVSARGNGLRLWHVRPKTLRPYLEPGDWITVNVDNYVERDPNSGNEIRGPVSGHGVIVEVMNKWGTDLLIWVRKIEDFIPAQGVVTRAGFGGVGKVQIFYQTTPPSAQGEKEGDLWFDTDDGDRFYQYRSGTWVDVQDTDIATAQGDATQALSDAAAAQSTADGRNTMFRQATAPTANAPGDIWFDSDDGDHIYRWSGSAWVSVLPDIDTVDLVGNIDLDSQISGTLSTAFAEAGLINSGVTINANGTLTGAGGGQASLTSLPGSVQVGSLAANAVTSGTIAALAITAAKIAANTITAGQIAANTITASEIAASTITATQIAASTITASEINVASLSAISANLGTVTAGTISASVLIAATTFTAGTASFSGQVIVSGNVLANNVDVTTHLTINSSIGPEALRVLEPTTGVRTASFISSATGQPTGIQMAFTGDAPNNQIAVFIQCSDTVGNRGVEWSNGDWDNQNNSYSGFSDRKLKQDIIDADVMAVNGAWEDHLAYRFRKFKLKTEVLQFGDEAKWMLGVVAQELELVSPGLVSRTYPPLPSGNTPNLHTLSTKYSIMYMKAMLVVQELQRRCLAQEAHIADHESRIALLEAA